jgi:spore coat polysaccharide biosynthesis predicted glycosyltransferase SpsG/RimJ/RimL family protein N-acetyltransferase
MGHVVRCLVLAEAWGAAGLPAEVLVPDEVLDLTHQLASTVAATGVAEGAPSLPADASGHRWVVLDGYDLGPEVTQEAGVDIERIVRIDDLGRSGDTRAAVLVDTDPAASACTDDTADGATLLLGPRYALLRPTTVPDRDVRDRPGHLVVVLGGDPAAATIAVLAGALADLNGGSDLSVDVLGGGDLTPITAVDGVQVSGFVTDVGAHLDRADLAVVAAGTVAWETCRRGIPSVLLATVDNQEPVAQSIAAAGAALHVDIETSAVREAVHRLVRDVDLRESLSRAGRQLVDGRGAARVVTALRSRDVTLRRVGTPDAVTLWNWVNDPATRAASFTTDPVPWEDHEAWLSDRLRDEDADLWLAEDAAGPWGLVRFHAVGDTAEIGVTVAPEHRGQGLAAPLIRSGVRGLFASRPATRVVDARIRPENTASVAAFDAAGFTRQPDSDPVRFRAERTDGW